MYRSEACVKRKFFWRDYVSYVVMTIYNFYMFDRHGTLLYYAEWNRRKYSEMVQEEVGPMLQQGKF